MPQNFFQQRKQALLTKQDKSFIGKWDDKIIKLCNKINSHPQYYTTSSCSGRIMIMIDKDKKAENLFKFVSHDLVKVKEFLKVINNKLIINNKNPSEGVSALTNSCAEGTLGRWVGKKIRNNKNLKFKQEPMILHVACEKLENANNFMQLAQKAGFKKVGILALNKRIIVEINGSEKLEFPLMQDGKLLVNENFLKIVIGKANKNLKSNWGKIKEFEKII